MKLSVECGVGGNVEVEIVNADTLSIEKTHRFKNVVTNRGLEGAFNARPGKNGYWPNRIGYGSEAHTGNPLHVTSWKSFMGSESASFRGSVNLVKNGNTATRTLTREILIEAKGEAWSLAEIGLINETSGYPITYARPTDSNGNPIVIQVGANELARIRYTLSVSYPITISEIQFGGGDTGIPLSAATFEFKWEQFQVLYWSPSATNAGIGSSSWFQAFKTSSFGTRVNSSLIEGESYFPPSELNDGAKYFGSRFFEGMTHLWTIDPPIQKNNQQGLFINWEFIFKNVT